MSCEENIYWKFVKFIHKTFFKNRLYKYKFENGYPANHLWKAPRVLDMSFTCDYKYKIYVVTIYHAINLTNVDCGKDYPKHLLNGSFVYIGFSTKKETKLYHQLVKFYEL